MELLKTIEDHEQFIFMNKPINTIEVLIQALKESTDEQFSHHSDDERNDFASWVEHVFNNKEVADKLREEKTREGTISLLQGEIEKRKTASEPVLQQKESVMNSEPKEKPMVAEELPGLESIKPILNEESSSSETESVAEEVKPLNFSETKNVLGESTISNEPIQDEIKPLESSEEQTESVAEAHEDNLQGTEDKMSSSEVSSSETESVIEETNSSKTENVAEAVKETSTDPINVEEERVGGPESVVTPITNENSNDVNIHPHHFCPWKFDCTKKEFMYGLFIGLLIGLIGMKLISVLIGA